MSSLDVIRLVVVTKEVANFTAYQLGVSPSVRGHAETLALVLSVAHHLLTKGLQGLVAELCLATAFLMSHSSEVLISFINRPESAKMLNARADMARRLTVLVELQLVA